MSKEIINLVKDRTVAFLYAFDKNLWYKTDKGFIFPVPIDDCGDASFLKKDNNRKYFASVVSDQSQSI